MMSPDLGLLLRVLVYLLIYCFGLNGIGFYSVVLLVCVISLYYYWSRKAKSVNDKDGPSYQEPWWRQDANVDKVEWLNKIIFNTWPHFDTFLRNFLVETCSSIGKDNVNW